MSLLALAFLPVNNLAVHAISIIFCSASASKDPRTVASRYDHWWALHNSANENQPMLSKHNIKVHLNLKLNIKNVASKI